ncbi:hypothetical protein FJU30_03630 [Affinibrenneria salicis]|uniref:DUF3592 domain-containing protein n=1 Tax=Affinibrenneria salicis TaxID=2590031 RepID=A0A5J5G679_9GAMM|nr:hypothetical protein [Affinibrenneria salicis]KAA9002631.1 hypothetical protein FJU30_01135 [Affinibrenneria salicis]KAA9003081.1 hypothetical protein FJU30_03630 [Affinibrenneria salicis]
MYIVKFITDNLTDPFFYVAIFVMFFFAYALISIHLGDMKKNKVRKYGDEAIGEVLDIKSRSGGNSGFVNVELKVLYVDKNNNKHVSKGVTVIDMTKIQNFQPGNKVNIKYIIDNPDKIIINIPSPLVRRSS